MRNSMLMTLSSLTIYNQKTLLSRTWLLKMWILFIVFLDWQNNGIYFISSLRGTGN